MPKIAFAAKASPGDRSSALCMSFCADQQEPLVWSVRPESFVQTTILPGMGLQAVAAPIGFLSYMGLMFVAKQTVMVCSRCPLP